MITKAQILRFAPQAKAPLVEAILDNWSLAQDAGIEETPARLHGFMASIAVETGGLQRVEENLNYTSVARLREIFGKYIKSDKAAQGYVRQPKKLAILVYGGRLGNKKGPATDGWDYRGGGMMQTTGRDNYRAVGFEYSPAQLRIPAIAFETAVAEWVKRKCNAIADSGDTKKLRKSINGGLNGYSDFLDWIGRAAKVWPKVSAPVPAARPEHLYEPAPADNIEDADEIVDVDTVRDVQTRLRELGYAEVGTPDGDLGNLTETAILAFRNEHGLPLTPTIDEELLTELAKAKPRNLAPDRAEAKPAEVRAQVPEVKANFFSKVWGWILGIPAAVGGVISGAMDAIPGAKGFLEPVREIATDVPGWFWFVGVGVVALAIVLIARGGEKKGVEAFQNGERR